MRASKKQKKNLDGFIFVGLIPVLIMRRIMHDLLMELTKWCAMQSRDRRHINSELDHSLSIRATRKTWPRSGNHWDSNGPFQIDRCTIPC